MNLRTFFKISKKKIILPIIVTLIIFIYVKSIGRTIECWYEMNVFDNFLISNSSFCSSPTILTVISQYMYFLIIPFLITYLVSCVVVYKLNKK